MFNKNNNNSNECNNTGILSFTDIPKELSLANPKYILFKGGESKSVNGDDYWYQTFIESDKFNILQIRTVAQSQIYDINYHRHIWYTIN